MPKKNANRLYLFVLFLQLYTNIPIRSTKSRNSENSLDVAEKLKDKESKKEQKHTFKSMDKPNEFENIEPIKELYKNFKINFEKLSNEITFVHKTDSDLYFKIKKIPHLRNTNNHDFDVHVSSKLLNYFESNHGTLFSHALMNEFKIKDKIQNNNLDNIKNDNSSTVDSERNKDNVVFSKTFFNNDTLTQNNYGMIPDLTIYIDDIGNNDPLGTSGVHTFDSNAINENDFPKAETHNDIKPEEDSVSFEQENNIKLHRFLDILNSVFENDESVINIYLGTEKSNDQGNIIMSYEQTPSQKLKNMAKPNHGISGINSDGLHDKKFFYGEDDTNRITEKPSFNFDSMNIEKTENKLKNNPTNFNVHLENNFTKRIQENSEKNKDKDKDRISPEKENTAKKVKNETTNTYINANNKEDYDTTTTYPIFDLETDVTSVNNNNTFYKDTKEERIQIKMKKEMNKPLTENVTTSVDQIITDDNVTLKLKNDLDKINNKTSVLSNSTGVINTTSIPSISTDINTSMSGVYSIETSRNNTVYQNNETTKAISLGKKAVTEFPTIRIEDKDFKGNNEQTKILKNNYQENTPIHYPQDVNQDQNQGGGGGIFSGLGNFFGSFVGSAGSSFSTGTIEKGVDIADKGAGVLEKGVNVFNGMKDSFNSNNGDENPGLNPTSLGQIPLNKKGNKKARQKNQEDKKISNKDKFKNNNNSNLSNSKTNINNQKHGNATTSRRENKPSAVEDNHRNINENKKHKNSTISNNHNNSTTRLPIKKDENKSFNSSNKVKTTTTSPKTTILSKKNNATQPKYTEKFTSTTPVSNKKLMKQENADKKQTSSSNKLFNRTSFLDSNGNMLSSKGITSISNQLTKLSEGVESINNISNSLKAIQILAPIISLLFSVLFVYKYYGVFRKLFCKKKSKK